MKILMIRVGRVILNILYSFFKLLPVKKKITYISRQMRTTPKDFSLIAKEMERRHPDYENVYLIKMIDSGIQSKIEYCFHMLKQMYHVATSEMVVLDTYCIVVSFLNQRESLKVVQIWHAMGSLKKFGLSILDTKEGSSSQIAEAMRMHQNYTYVFCSGEYSRPYFAEAFGVRLDQMVIMPLPRLDLLTDEAYVNEVVPAIKKAYPQVEDDTKKVIVYAPTFRKDERRFQRELKRFANRIDTEKYTLIISQHPLSETVQAPDSIIQDKIFDSVDLCRFADLVVLDYSAVLFEIMNLDKPVAFFDFDFDEYTDKRSFYMDYKTEMPGPIFDTLEDLLSYIESESYDESKLQEFKKQMVLQHPGQTYTDACVDFIERTLQINA